MSNLPTGSVLFLFTDIERSTRVWEHPSVSLPLILADDGRPAPEE